MYVLHSALQEGVTFRPHVNWYGADDALALRREIARTVLDLSHFDWTDVHVQVMYDVHVQGVVHVILQSVMY